MKSLILLISVLSVSQAFAFDTSKLGNMMEYTCVVEIHSTEEVTVGEEIITSQTYFVISQTCDSSETTQIDRVLTSSMKLPMIQVKVIKSLREKGMHLITQSTDTKKTSMIFQKRDIE